MARIRDHTRERAAADTRHPAERGRPSTHASVLLALQRRVGNAAVADMIVQLSAGGKHPDDRVATGPPATGPAAVQRWAFVDGTRVPADGLKGRMAEWANDSVVRAYENDAEFKDHARGGTDYLGNLRDGTWVRFHPTKTNLLGETHTQVTLHQVLVAVGALNKKFLYEPFATEKLPDKSQTKAEYKALNRDRFEAFGMSGSPGKEKHGAESLFPKIGAVLAGLRQYFVDGQAPSPHVGRTIADYLRVAWGYAGDIQAGAAGLRVRHSTAQDNLATVYGRNRDTLQPFITGLAAGSRIDIALAGEAQQQTVRDALDEFCQAVLRALPEQAALPSEGLGTEQDPAQQVVSFRAWREAHMAAALRGAVRSGVRYVGLGSQHVDNLRRADKEPDNCAVYLMDGDDLDRFRRNTDFYRGLAENEW